MWLWKKYQIYRGYTPSNENKAADQYRNQLEEIAESDAAIDKELEATTQSLATLRKKEKVLTNRCNMCHEALEALSREDVVLTEAQKNAKEKITSVIEDELRPVIEQLHKKIEHLELMVCALQEKKADVKSKHTNMEEYLCQRDSQFPLHNINVLGDTGQDTTSNKSTTEEQPSPPSLNNNVDSSVDEAHIPQDTPIIQMTDALLSVDNDDQLRDSYLPPQRVMAGP